ncbi:hypothetical protein A2U01_0056297 [Trifolium medium]|uniref:Uncharacterized protein n=1 Tax=Trifolium medium TaxID=97028 RepID=A0A392RGX4_9FABA|nr:hypothetical protein [Trifolium medium]
MLAGRAETAEVSGCTRWARNGEGSQKILPDFQDTLAKRGTAR